MKDPKIWFISEIIQSIIVIMGAITLLWLYAPINIIAKIIITAIACFIYYDMFRIFVVVKNLMMDANGDFLYRRTKK